MNPQHGTALIIAVMGVCLTAALGASLAVMTGTEMMIAANYVRAKEAGYAAEAGLEIGMQELGAQPDWIAVLSGTASSTFADGAPAGTRNLGDGSALDLTALISQTAMENPAWRLFAFGPLRHIQSAQDRQSDDYVVVWVGSDPAGDAASVTVRADAFGPAGARRTVEATARKTEDGGVRMVSWREIR
jgi:hypothetical protein